MGPRAVGFLSRPDEDPQRGFRRGEHAAGQHGAEGEEDK